MKYPATRSQADPSGLQVRLKIVLNNAPDPTHNTARVRANEPPHGHLRVKHSCATRQLEMSETDGIVTLAAVTATNHEDQLRNLRLKRHTPRCLEHCTECAP